MTDTQGCVQPNPLGAENHVLPLSLALKIELQGILASASDVGSVQRNKVSTSSPHFAVLTGVGTAPLA